MASGPSWEIFDVLADRYVGWYDEHRALALSELDAFREAIRGLEPPCADIGAGHGFFTPGSCVAVEPSVALAARAARVGLQVVVGRAEALPLRDGSMNYVSYVVTLCFLEDPVASLREAFRVVRQGGYLVACIIRRDSAWGQHYARLASAGHPFYSRARFYSLGEVRSMAEEAGFQMVDAVGTLRGSPGQERYERPARFSGLESFVCAKFKRA